MAPRSSVVSQHKVEGTVLLALPDCRRYAWGPFCTIVAHCRSGRSLNVVATCSRVIQTFFMLYRRGQRMYLSHCKSHCGSASLRVRRGSKYQAQLISKVEICTCNETTDDTVQDTLFRERIIAGVIGLLEIAIQTANCRHQALAYVFPPVKPNPPQLDRLSMTISQCFRCMIPNSQYSTGRPDSEVHIPAVGSTGESLIRRFLTYTIQMIS